MMKRMAIVYVKTAGHTPPPPPLAIWCFCPAIASQWESPKASDEHPHASAINDQWWWLFIYPWWWWWWSFASCGLLDPMVSGSQGSLRKLFPFVSAMTTPLSNTYSMTTLEKLAHLRNFKLNSVTTQEKLNYLKGNEHTYFWSLCEKEKAASRRNVVWKDKVKGHDKQDSALQCSDLVKSKTWWLQSKKKQNPHPHPLIYLQGVSIRIRSQIIKKNYWKVKIILVRSWDWSSR